MYDRWEYTVPANTAEADAIRVKCKVTPGMLTRLRVYHPQGCENLVRGRVFLGEKPIAPRSSKNYLAGEGFVCDIRDARETISEDLPVLNWELWNLDDTYNHTPWIDAEWTSEYEPYEKKIHQSIHDFVTDLRRLIGL